MSCIGRPAGRRELPEAGGPDGSFSSKRPGHGSWRSGLPSPSPTRSPSLPGGFWSASGPVLPGCSSWSRWPEADTLAAGCCWRTPAGTHHSVCLRRLCGWVPLGGWMKQAKGLARIACIPCLLHCCTELGCRPCNIATLNTIL